MLRLLLIAFALAPITARAQDDAPNPQALFAQANAAYDAEDYAACGPLYMHALEAGFTNAAVPYNGACCFALAGETDEAFAALTASLDAGWRDVDHLQADRDLDALHDDARWTEAVAAAEANYAAYAETVNQELMEMHAADQSERRALLRGELTWEVVGPNDDRRRTRVYEMIEAGEVESADDHFHAAMILQHGRDSTDYRNARDFAQRATELDPSHGTAHWLVAAATDRYLWSIDEPQIYGTQSTTDNDGRWTMEPIDEEAVTDAERAARGVPPLEQAYARLAERNAELEAEMDAERDADATDRKADEDAGDQGNR